LLEMYKLKLIAKKKIKMYKLIKYSAISFIQNTTKHVGRISAKIKYSWGRLELDINYLHL